MSAGHVELPPRNLRLVAIVPTGLRASSEARRSIQLRRRTRYVGSMCRRAGLRRVSCERTCRRSLIEPRNIVDACPVLDETGGRL
jgi:hypothetical protein